MTQVVQQGAQTWTAAQIAAGIAEQYGLARSAAHVRRWLKRAGLTYQRTSASLRHKQDLAVNTAYRADLETLEKGAAGALALCHLDEAGFTLTLPTTYSWMPRGRRLTVPYETTQNRRVNVIAAVITHGPQAGEFTYESYATLPHRERRDRNRTTRRRRHVRD